MGSEWKLIYLTWLVLLQNIELRFLVSSYYKQYSNKNVHILMYTHFSHAFVHLWCTSYGIFTFKVLLMPVNCLSESSYFISPFLTTVRYYLYWSIYNVILISLYKRFHYTVSIYPSLRVHELSVILCRYFSYTVSMAIYPSLHVCELLVIPFSILGIPWTLVLKGTVIWEQDLSRFLYWKEEKDNFQKIYLVRKKKINYNSEKWF